MGRSGYWHPPALELALPPRPPQSERLLFARLFVGVTNRKYVDMPELPAASTCSTRAPGTRPIVGRNEES